MRGFLIGLLVLISAVVPGTVRGSVLGGQVLADKSSEYSPSYFGLWGNMTLMQDRFPLVVYLDRTSGVRLRCVDWSEGAKRDQPMFDVDFYTSNVWLAAHGEKVCVSWQVINPSGGSSQIFYSQRVDGVWSARELVIGGSSLEWSMGIGADGTPVGAAAVESFYTSSVKWLVRGPEGWTATEIAAVNRSTSSVALTLDPAGKPTVAWRAYSSSSNPAQVQYARKEAEGWVRKDVAGASLIGTLFNGPAGEPCMIARTTNESASFFVTLTGEAVTPVQVTAFGGEVTSAIALPDGTMFATLGSSLIVRRNGVWSESYFPYTHTVVADAGGALHFLGVEKEVLHYRTLLPGELPVLQRLSSYEDGQAHLDDLVMHPDGKPRIFGWVGATKEFSPQAGTWISKPVQKLLVGWLYAYDRSGRRHAFSEWGAYAVADDQDVMKVTSLPVSISTSSSSSICDFFLDKNDVPHAGFYSGVGTYSAKVLYATKPGVDWVVETVSAAELSDQHCALALDPAGMPWMFTSRGLFRRSTTGWVQEFVTSGVNHPALGIASDGSVHAVYQMYSRLISLTGKNGSYTTTVVDSSPVTSAALGFAMAGDRPLLAYAKQLQYSPARDAIVLAEKVGGNWRQIFVSPPSEIIEAGPKFQLITTSAGKWTIAGLLTELRNSLYREKLVVYEGELAKFDPKKQEILHSRLLQGGRFQIDLGSGPFSGPLDFEGSASLDAWTPIFRLGPDSAPIPERRVCRYVAIRFVRGSPTIHRRAAPRGLSGSRVKWRNRGGRRRKGEGRVFGLGKKRGGALQLCEVEMKF